MPPPHDQLPAESEALNPTLKWAEATSPVSAPVAAWPPKSCSCAGRAPPRCRGSCSTGVSQTTVRLHCRYKQDDKQAASVTGPCNSCRPEAAASTNADGRVWRRQSRSPGRPRSGPVIMQRRHQWLHTTHPPAACPPSGRGRTARSCRTGLATLALQHRHPCPLAFCPAPAIWRRTCAAPQTSGCLPACGSPPPRGRTAPLGPAPRCWAPGRPPPPLQPQRGSRCWRAGPLGARKRAGSRRPCRCSRQPAVPPLPRS